MDCRRRKRSCRSVKQSAGVLGVSTIKCVLRLCTLLLTWWSIGSLCLTFVGDGCGARRLQALIDDTIAKKIAPTNTERGVQKAAKRVFVQFAEFLEEHPWAMVLLVLPLLGLGYLAFRASDDTPDDPNDPKNK